MWINYITTDNSQGRWVSGRGSWDSGERKMEKVLKGYDDSLRIHEVCLEVPRRGKRWVDRLAMVIPTRSDNSVSDILRCSMTISRLILMVLDIIIWSVIVLVSSEKRTRVSGPVPVMPR